MSAYHLHITILRNQLVEPRGMGTLNSPLVFSVSTVHTINTEKLPFYDNVVGPSLSNTHRTAKINLFTSMAIDIIRILFRSESFGYRGIK